MPRKVFVAGEILTAADVNEFLSDQVVMTFAGTAARGSAIGTAVEGMVTYLEDTDSFEYWDGSAWDELTLPVSTTTPVSGDSLVYDGTNWVNGPRSGNAIINGDFGIWQRGTSFTEAAGGANPYTADRWQAQVNGGTAVITQESFTPADIEAIGYGDAEYFVRYDTTDVSGMTFSELRQPVEDVRTFAGQDVTLSFWAKVDSAYTLDVRLRQDFGSGGSSPVNFDSSVAVGTTWQRYSLTFSLGSVSGATIGSGSSLRVVFRPDTSGTNTLDIWGVQLEAGPVATPFKLAGGGSKAAELALCQRYYYKHVEGDNQAISIGAAYSASRVYASIKFPVAMRTSPTLVQSSGTDYYEFAREAGSERFTDFSNIQDRNENQIEVFRDSLSHTSGVSGVLRTSNASASMAFDAEL